MKSSNTSSATATPRPSAQPPRKAFALTGPSTALDPRRHAVRLDLADVRLAEQVFAPHYAAPIAHRLTRAAPLRADREAAAEPVGELAAGDAFDLLDLVRGQAWGIAPDRELVGWLDADALERVA